MAVTGRMPISALDCIEFLSTISSLLILIMIVLSKVTAFVNFIVASHFMMFSSSLALAQ